MLKYKFYFAKSFYNIDVLFRLRRFALGRALFKHNVWGFRFLPDDALFIKKLHKRLLSLPTFFFPLQHNTLVSLRTRYSPNQGQQRFQLPFSFCLLDFSKKRSQHILYLYFYKSARVFLKNMDLEVSDLSMLLTKQKLHFAFSSKIFVFNELQKYIRNAQVRKTRILFFDAFSLPYYIEVIFGFENNCFSSLISSFFLKF